MSRRIEVDSWVMSTPFRNFKIEKGGPLGIDYIRVDAIFAIDSVPSVVVGRLRDRGSGMHGWYAIMIKQEEHAIDFKKTQRYRV
jgi:hypothetical protein